MPIVHVTGKLFVMERLGGVPKKTRGFLKARLTGFIEELHAESVARAPVKTGKLRSEIISRVYSDNPERIAGYVVVATGGNSNEHAKAAALEYGVWAAPHPRTGSLRRLLGNNRRAKARVPGARHIRAYRYLRGPFEDAQGQFQAVVAETVGSVVAETNTELA